MKTAQDVIIDFQALPLDQQEEVIHYVASHHQQETFSDDDTALILQAKEEAAKGIKMSGPFKGKEAIDFLTELENQDNEWYALSRQSLATAYSDNEPECLINRLK